MNRRGPHSRRVADVILARVNYRKLRQSFRMVFVRIRHDHPTNAVYTRDDVEPTIANAEANRVTP
jgi:hypothetical protein